MVGFFAPARFARRVRMGIISSPRVYVVQGKSQELCFLSEVIFCSFINMPTANEHNRTYFQKNNFPFIFCFKHSFENPAVHEKKTKDNYETPCTTSTWAQAAPTPTPARRRGEWGTGLGNRPCLGFSGVGGGPRHTGRGRG